MSSSEVVVTSEAPSAGDAERRRITGRAGIVASGTLLSRLLGLGRDQVLAAVFSRSATDAFFIAFLIPNLLRQLLAEGAAQSAVLPVLTETRERQGEAAARGFFRAARGLSLVVLAAAAAVGIVLAPELVDAFAHGFHKYPGQYERTVELTRWVFPYIFFMGSAALGIAALNAYQRFVVTSFAPGLLNIAFIVCALLLPTWLASRGRDPVLAMAIGALIGGALQLVAQWPSLRRIGYLSWPKLDLSHPGVRLVFRRLGPILVGLGVYALDVLISRRFLSELGLGAQSYFGWALRLCDFPQGIFVLALQTATLPSLALLVARGERREVEKTFAYGMRLSLFVGLAATALFVALAEPLVVAIFQRGKFDALASRETARALMAQGLGIWMVAAVRQLVAVYYALGDTRTPVVVAMLDLMAFVAFAVALRKPLGHVGISFAVTGASAVQMLLLWAGLRRRLDDLRVFEVAASAGRTLVAALSAGVISFMATHGIERGLGDSAVARLAPGVAGALIFAASFLLVAWLLKSPELRALTSVLSRRR